MYSGRIPPPPMAEKLYNVVEAVCMFLYIQRRIFINEFIQAEEIDESGLPSKAYVPGPPPNQQGQQQRSRGQTLFDAEGTH